MDEIRVDVLVVGGSLGGVAAAIRAGEMGATVALIEESDWIGGQLTSQGVCTPDENRWVESGGCTASYEQLRNRIRNHYKTGYKLRESGGAQEHFNPGNCWVSGLSVEPKVARAILTDMLAIPNLTVRLGIKVTEAERRINTISAIIGRDRDGSETRFTAPYILDATELGDLLPMAGIDHVIGA